MAFFNADFLETAISTAWETQRKALRAQQLQNHNDMLFTVVRDDILGRRAALHQDLMTVARTSLTPQGLTIPLWTYKVAHYGQPFKTVVGTPEFDSMEEMLKRKGHHWTVGLVNPSFNLDTFALNPEEDLDSLWRWRTPQPVDYVIRSTDFMNRIALLFGEFHYWVSKRVVGRTILNYPLEVVVETVELTLHYFPRGTNGRAREALQKTKAKYEAHWPTDLAGLRPYVWKGMPEPGFSNASPIASAVPASPPPLLKRSNCTGIARRLFTSSCHYQHDSDSE